LNLILNSLFGEILSLKKEGCKLTLGVQHSSKCKEQMKTTIIIFVPLGTSIVSPL
jgi:hypothetical protein